MWIETGVVQTDLISLHWETRVGVKMPLGRSPQCSGADLHR